MAELLKREDAVLQEQLWVPSSYNLGGARIQCREVRINGPGLEGKQEQCSYLGMQQEVWILFSLMTCAWNILPYRKQSYAPS